MFEWAWQNPLQSRRLNTLPKRKTRESLLLYHIRLLDKMLSSPPWIRLPLCVHCLSTNIMGNLEELLPCKPIHMKVLLGPPSIGSVTSKNEGMLDCGLCNGELLGVKLVKCYNNKCTFAGHVTCLASYMLSGSDQILPITGPCPSCHITLLWGRLMKPQQLTSIPLVE
uniref:Structure-specific endonuclease subunit SLX1 n=1 Tax=Lygus hesperus TaxID=30085 RepID=A0A0A9ZJ38_LYGHE